MLKKTIFISDLHLSENHPQMTKRFVDLIKQYTTSADALYILGDLFEAWIGDDYDGTVQRDVINALSTATQNGLPIYFLPGNRDFLIGKRFLRATGCKLLADEEKINLYGTPVLLMHGDTLCTLDTNYLSMRKKFRNKFIQTIFLWLPLALRLRIVDSMRNDSERYKKVTANEIMDVTQQAVEKVMQKHDVDFLIHGHTHRPAIHEFMQQENKAKRIVLADWHDDRGSMFVWDETGKQEIVTLYIYIRYRKISNEGKS